MKYPSFDLPSLLPVLAVIAAFALAIGVVVRSPPGRPTATPAPVARVAPVELRALGVLREAGTWVSLAALAEAIDDTPGTVALALAGHPGADVMVGRNGSRWYRFVAP